MSKRKIVQRDPFGRFESEYEEEDDAFNNGVLRDGAATRVSLFMCDGAINPELSPTQIAVAQAQARNDGVCIATDAKPTIVDAMGGTAGLTRPGARYSVAGHKTIDHAQQVTQRAVLDELYRQHDQDEAERYLHVDATGPQEGVVCMVSNPEFPLDQGSPGHIRNGVCAPDRPRTDAATVEDAYRQYDDAAANAWRTR
jgi:hypothetical protein